MRYELVVLGEGVELFSIAVPPSLAGRRPADSGMLGSLEQRRKFGELFEITAAAPRPAQ